MGACARSRSGFRSRLRAVAMAATALALMTAGAAPATARGDTDDDDDDNGVVGSWLGTATATTVPLPPLATMLTFNSDGTATEAHRPFLSDSPLGPLVLTAGHGAWISTGHRTVSVKLLLIYEGAPNHPTAAGQVLALETVRFKLTVSGKGQKLTGTLVDEIRDNDGNVVFVGPGTFTATRIVAEP